MNNKEYMPHIQRNTAARRGQTIVEAIVGITLLTTGFLGMFTLLSRSFFLNRVTGDETRATYLAAEGIEIAKSLIDHDVYQHLAVPPAGLGWGSCFAAYPTAGTTGFEMDYTTVNCGTLTTYTARTLSFDPVTGFYSYAGGGGTVATPFARRIRVTQNGSEIVVNSIVTWSVGPLTAQSLNLEDHFFNWHP